MFLTTHKLFVEIINQFLQFYNSDTVFSKQLNPTTVICMVLVSKQYHIIAITWNKTSMFLRKGSQLDWDRVNKAFDGIISHTGILQNTIQNIFAYSINDSQYSILFSGINIDTCISCPGFPRN